jgi:hypothetical protein
MTDRDDMPARGWEMPDRRGAMNRVSVDVQGIEGRAQVVLIVEEVDSGLKGGDDLSDCDQRPTDCAFSRGGG